MAANLDSNHQIVHSIFLFKDFCHDPVFEEYEFLKQGGYHSMIEAECLSTFEPAINKHS